LQLWTSWKKDNPAPSVKCEAAMKRYLCRDALPGCSEVSAESSKDICRIKAFSCKSVCTAAVPVCTMSGNAKDEKGGRGWLKCDTTPTGQTFEPGCCGNATVRRGYRAEKMCALSPLLFTPRTHHVLRAG
jgi:hypothetical protein